MLLNIRCASLSFFLHEYIVTFNSIEDKSIRKYSFKISEINYYSTYK